MGRSNHYRCDNKAPPRQRLGSVGFKWLISTVSRLISMAVETFVMWKEMGSKEKGSVNRPPFLIGFAEAILIGFAEATPR